MAIRTDVTVDWNVSPRIITVLAPSVNITLQDLHDTLIDFEDEPFAMTYLPLIRSEGKADLGGGVLTGITSTLLNAKLAFEARKTFVSTGTVTTTDATGKILTDSGAMFVTDSVEPGAWIINQTTGEIASVLRISSETALVTNLIAGGFTSGDVYKMVNVTQCEVNGGNLVAVDAAGASTSSVLPTAGTQVKITAASSATLQEQADIEYASFDSAVHVDLTSAYSGTDFPVGTPRQPVNNFADALAIANTRGFSDLNIAGNVTIDAGLDYDSITFIGESQTKSTFTIDPAAQVANCEFYNATIQGTLDGGSKIRDCLILDLDYVDGFIKNCILQGTITLAGDAAHFLNCWSGVPGSSTPIIDFNGIASALALRNYNGGITLKNKTAAGDVSIDLNSGQIVLENTVTVGTIICRGLGKLTDNSAGATVDATHLVRPAMIANSVWDETAASHVAAGSMGELQNAGGSLTPTQSTMLLEMYQLLGLDPTKPLVVTPTTRRVPANGADIAQTITQVGDDVTVQRV